VLSMIHNLPAALLLPAAPAFAGSFAISFPVARSSAPLD